MRLPSLGPRLPPGSSSKAPMVNLLVFSSSQGQKGRRAGAICPHLHRNVGPPCMNKLDVLEEYRSVVPLMTRKQRVFVAEAPISTHSAHVLPCQRVQTLRVMRARSLCRADESR